MLHPANAPAPRPRRRVARLAARIVGGLAAVVVVGAGATYLASERALHRPVRVPAHPAPSVATLDAATRGTLVARGAHVVATRGCADCHGATLGGAVVIDDPLAGRLAGPNLTGGGRGAALTDADWELALRHGVRRDGAPLAVMPSTDYAAMTDEDVAAVIAYARSLPAVTTQPPAMRLGPLLRVLYLAGKADVVPAHTLAARGPVTAHVARIVPAPTRAYGQYVATTCSGCHGATFTGGPIPGAPPDWPAARNITPHPTAGIGRWTAADFDRLLTTGVRPDGKLVDTTHMPVRMTRAMTPLEREALWAYLRTVPAAGAGGQTVAVR